MPVLRAPANPKLGEREVLAAMPEEARDVVAEHPGVLMITDNGLSGRTFEGIAVRVAQRVLANMRAAAVHALVPTAPKDDIVLLLARTPAIEADRIGTWTLACDPALRLVRDRTLICEVSDGSSAPAPAVCPARTAREAAVLSSSPRSPTAAAPATPTRARPSGPPGGRGGPIAAARMEYEAAEVILIALVAGSARPASHDRRRAVRLGVIGRSCGVLSRSVPFDL
jgi:hypothetical protein